ncbi:Transposase protein [Popillia japonica]|uniref:Transposase protein n=1 Tax=Popillia japonica TaxID=7064 RepID=A0AAW1N348_POPJA
MRRSRHVHGSPHLEHSYAASSNVATDVALEHVSPSTSFAESNPEPGTSRIRQHVKVDDRFVCLVRENHAQNMEPLLKSLSIRKASELSPKARHLYRRALLFKRKSIAQRKKTQCFHSELAKAVKYSQRRQIKCLPKKPKGRRFTIEDKITALALYKQSGAGYKFLRQIFALPSRITIMRLLNSVPIEAGINQCVFDGLKEIQKNLKPLERFSCYVA